MGVFKRNSTFFLAAVLIVVVGIALFGGVVAVRVLAETAPVVSEPVASQPASYNVVSSYGMTGYTTLSIEPTADTPKFIAKRLDENRGVVLLVYVRGASDDMEMVSYFNDIKATYAADSSFFSFETRDSSQLGDLLEQLHVSDPPILAVIRGDGAVAGLYTGWISYEVMEQEIADAVRGL